MGTVSNMLGFGGGQSGTGIASPSGANIVNPTDPTQIKDAYTGSQTTLAQQQALLQALQAQNGLANQSNVYGQLSGIANGTGPNPAKAMLNNATGANVANQAALMASQRGAGSNVGMMARQAGMQGANLQQQAVGQGAAMQANQSMNALGQMGNMANSQVANQVGQTNANTMAQQAQHQALLTAQQGVNNSNVGMQSNQNSVNGQLANTAMGGQQSFIGGLMGGAGTLMGLAEGGEVPDTSVPTFAPAPQGGTDPKEMIMKALPAMIAMASGGPIPTTDVLPAVAPIAPVVQPTAPAAAAQSTFGKFLQGYNSRQPGQDMATQLMPQAAGPQADLRNGASQMVQGMAKGLSKPSAATTRSSSGAQGGPAGRATMLMSTGGAVPAMVSPGEEYLAPAAVKEVATKGKNPLEVGETIPGKPKVAGAKNSYANDTVPKTLESGGIVIPRSITQSKDPAKGAAEFVAAILKQKAQKSKKQGSK